MVIGMGTGYGEMGYHSQSEDEFSEPPAKEPQKKKPLPETAANQDLIKVWLACKLHDNPAKFTALSTDPSGGELKYHHPIHKEITLDNLEIRCPSSPIYKSLYEGIGGINSIGFAEFSNGFLGIGKRPGFFHPIRRSYYNDGVEARTRTDWDEREIPPIEEDDGRTPPVSRYHGGYP